MKFALVIGVVMLSLSTPVIADDKTSGDPVAEAKKQSANKKVCKKVKVTGSHFKQRVCMKRSEWDDMRRDSQRAARDMTGSRSSGSSGS